MSEAAWSSRMRAGTWLARISVASAAPIAEFGGRFLRTIILSRLLSPVEFGTSVALTVVLGTALMISDIGLDRFVLLKPEQEGRRVLAAAHVIQIMRGLVVAAGMIVLAPFAAALIHVSDAEASFVWAALIPLLHSCAHLGPKQAHRNYDFRQDAVATLAASGASLLATIAAVWIFRDHNAILMSLIAGEVVYVGATHMVSHRKFELALDRQIAREALRYGLPLMLNGVGLAIFAQADRMLVGSIFGVETLGVYAVIVSLAIAAISPFYAICSSLGISIAARNRSDSGRLPNLFVAITWGFGLFGFGYCALTGLGLDLIVPKVFGVRYVVEPGVRIVLSMIVFVRILRGPPSILLLVDGETTRLTFANLLAGIGLAFAFIFLRASPTLQSVLLGMLVGDLLSLALFQIFLFRQAVGFGWRLLTILVFECAAALGFWGALASATGGALGGRASIGLACCLVAAWMAGRSLSAAGQDEIVRGCA